MITCLLRADFFLSVELKSFLPSFLDLSIIYHQMAAKSTENAKVENGAQFTLPPIVGINFGNSYASIAVRAKVSKIFFQGFVYTDRLRK